MGKLQCQLDHDFKSPRQLVSWGFSLLLFLSPTFLFSFPSLFFSLHLSFLNVSVKVLPNETRPERVQHQFQSLEPQWNKGRKKKKASRGPAFSPLCVFSVMRTAMATHACCCDISSKRTEPDNCTATPWKPGPQTNPPSLTLFLSGIFATAVRKIMNALLH